MDSHVVSARRRGVTDDQIAALESPDTWADHFDAREIAALRLADALAGDESHELGEGLVAEVRSHYTEGELAELLLVAGQANLNNRVGNAAKQVLGSSETD